MENVLILSRHKPTIDYLKKIYPTAKIIEHLDIENIQIYDEYDTTCMEGCCHLKQQNIFIGNAPLSIISEILERGDRFILIDIKADRGQRGKDIEILSENFKLIEIASIKLKEVIFK